MVLPPRQVHELTVGAGAKHNCVAVSKMSKLAIELCNFRRTNEREIHRPKENDRPLSINLRIVDRLELFPYFD